MKADSNRLERRALHLSIVGALSMAVIGIGFALLSGSEAIMLDGVFSSISVVMALLTLKVAALVARPDDEHFHYGYAHFAPLMNVIKSMLMLVLVTFAFLVAVDSLMKGGRPLAVGIAVVYGIIATAGCVIITLLLHQAARKSGSALVAVDVRSWIVDTLMSTAVLASFIVGYFASQTAMAQYLDYLDPALVAILCVASLPVPIRILLDNGREVLLFAPDPALTIDVEQRIGNAIRDLQDAELTVRLLKMGSKLNILAHVILPPDYTLDSVSQLDDIRANVAKSLNDMEVTCIVDVVFTSDPSLAD
jgi:cation diffusion facilitator family transporter